MCTWSSFVLLTQNNLMCIVQIKPDIYKKDQLIQKITKSWFLFQ